MSSLREAKTHPDRSLRAGRKLVLEDLARFGPESQTALLDLKAAQAYCKTLAKRHYENFSVASWFVPANLRQDLFNIYAYCRWSEGSSGGRWRGGLLGREGFGQELVV